MKVIRNETGRFIDLGTLKSFDLIDVDSEIYGNLVMALNHTIELYALRKWHLESDSPNSVELIEQYQKYQELLALFTDYKNHVKTFNGKKINN